MEHNVLVIWTTFMALFFGGEPCYWHVHVTERTHKDHSTPPPPEMKARGEDGAVASFPRQPRKSHLERQRLDQLIEAITEETRLLCQIS